MKKPNSDKASRFVNPPNALKIKVGSGGIPMERIEEAEEAIAANDYDFSETAENYIQKIDHEINVAKENLKNSEKQKERIYIFFMQLKGAGAMFHYDLISDVAAVAMRFLEVTEEMNEDSLALLDRHKETVRVIVKNKLIGDGEKHGYALIKELEDACKRFYAKHNVS